MSSDLLKMLSEPTVDGLVAGRVLGLSGSATYKALKAGEIPSIRIGRLWRVPTAPLKQMLGLSQEASAA